MTPPARFGRDGDGAIKAAICGGAFCRPACSVLVAVWHDAVFNVNLAAAQISPIAHHSIQYQYHSIFLVRYCYHLLFRRRINIHSIVPNCN
jgi:hypothetical protein